MVDFATAPDNAAATAIPAPVAPGPAAAPAPGDAASAPSMPDLSNMDPAAASRMFQDPAFLRSAAQVFLARGLPQGVQWLQRSHEAAKENAFDALARLEQGDAEGAVKAFNASGRFTDATGAVKNDDGTWTLKRASGPDITLDPMAMRKSLLSPKDYFQQQAEEARARTADRQATTAEKNADTSARLADVQDRYRADQAEHYRRLDDNSAERNQLTADVANARAQGAAATAAARAEADKTKAELNNKYGYAATYQQHVKDLTAQGVPPEQIPAKAQLLARSQFTTISPKPGGGFVVVDSSSGKPMSLGEFGDYQSANAAASDWVSGKGIAAPPPAATAKKGAPKAKPEEALFPRRLEAAAAERAQLGRTLAPAGRGLVSTLTGGLFGRKDDDDNSMGN